MAASFSHEWFSDSWATFLDLPADGPVYRQATAMALAAVVVTQIGNLTAHRTEVLSALHVEHNQLLLPGLVAEMTMPLLFLYLPSLASIIDIEAFPASQTLVLLGLLPLLLVVDELRKWLARGLQPKLGRQSHPKKTHPLPPVTVSVGGVRRVRRMRRRSTSFYSGGADLHGGKILNGRYFKCIMAAHDADCAIDRQHVLERPRATPPCAAASQRPSPGLDSRSFSRSSI